MVLSSQIISSAIDKVNVLDFSPINQKLRTVDENFWTNENLQIAEGLYKKFLTLRLLDKDAILVPTEVIDEYWHQHILDTRKYQADCNQLFGGMLHHDPYFGLKDEEERQLNLQAFENTQRLWQEVFGENLVGESNRCGSTDCR